MAQNGDAPKYPALLIAIHWLVALCVLGLLLDGLIMTGQDEGLPQERMFTIDEPLGLIVLALTALRLILRMSGRMPPPAAVLTAFERVASRAAHFSLYFLLIITPIVGWLGISAYGEDVRFFGLFRLPAILAKDEELADQIFAVYMACGLLLALVVVAHVTGAVVHKLRHDGVNERMLPGR